MYYQFYNDGPVFEQKGQTMYAVTSVTGHFLTVSTVDFPLHSRCWQGPLSKTDIKHINAAQAHRSAAYDKQMKQNSVVIHAARELAIQQSRDRIAQNQRNARKTTAIVGRR